MIQTTEKQILRSAQMTTNDADRREANDARSANDH